MKMRKWASVVLTAAMLFGMAPNPQALLGQSGEALAQEGGLAQLAYTVQDMEDAQAGLEQLLRELEGGFPESGGDRLQPEEGAQPGHHEGAVEDVGGPFRLMYDSDEQLAETIGQLPALRAELDRRLALARAQAMAARPAPARREDPADLGPEWEGAPPADAEAASQDEGAARLEAEKAVQLQAENETRLLETITQAALRKDASAARGLGLPEEVENEIAEAIGNAGEDRFIVEYKDGEGSGVLAYIRNTGTAVEIGALTELITLDGRVNPKDLAEELRGAGMGGQIAYIQPDFALSVDALGLALVPGPDDQGDSGDIGEPDPGNGDVEANNEGTDRENRDGADAGDIDKEEAEGVAKEPAGETAQKDKTGPTPVGGKVTVAVIDTGVDTSHPMLAPYVTGGWDFIAGGDVLYDPADPLASAHGTHVAGVIAQAAAQYGADVEILPLKVFENGAAYTSDVIAAIAYADAHGAAVINCSFGSKNENPALRGAIAASGALFIAAAGNSGRDLAEIPSYPAAYRLGNLASVGSANADGGYSYFSNYSDTYVDIAALGRGVASALPGGGEGPMTGTSVAAAQVSGAAAVALSLTGSIEASALRERLFASADKLANLYGKAHEGRRLNLGNALSGMDGSVLDLQPADDFSLEGYAQDGDGYSLYSGGVKPMVAGGEYQSLLLKTDGSVWAWGRNTFGQLGDGTTVQRLAPVQVLNLAGVAAIDTYYQHSLALKSDGTVWAWGRNLYGQIGDGTTTERWAPKQVAGLSGILGIATGYNHSLAIKSDHTVWAWGRNANGQLGDGSTTDRLTPVQVPGLTNVVAVAGGAYFSAALKSDGSVWAWGYNVYGNLGNNSTTASLTPVQVSAITDIKEIAAGSNHTLARKGDGTLWGWGRNEFGQLGNGSTADKKAPVQVSGLAGVAEIAACGSHSYALKTDGSAWGWGANAAYQLGDNTTDSRLAPVQMLSLKDMAAVGAGQYHGLAIKNDGLVWAWGDNTQGQLGVGAAVSSPWPAPPGTLAGVTAMAGGEYHSLALKGDGSVWSWGRNAFGQLGDGTTADRWAPVQALNLTGVAAIDTFYRHSLALKNDGSVWAWGRNLYGQLGDGTTTERWAPKQVPGLTGVVAVAAGYNHSLAVKSDGSVYAWGRNGNGQLGDGTTIDRLTPLQVPGLANIVAVAGGGYFSLALRSDGVVFAWGYNTFGNLGNNSTTASLAPVQVSTITDIKEIATGFNHSLARKGDGTLWSWGYNEFGQLGDGSVTMRKMPVQVAGLAGVAEIAACGSHSSARKADGTIWGWGTNAGYQLNDGTATDRLAPVQALTLGSIATIGTGQYHGLAVKNDGSPWAWGDNGDGQLGAGITGYYFGPACIRIAAYPDAPAASVQFSQPSYAVVKDAAGPLLTTLTLQAKAYDASAAPAAGKAIHYSLAQPYAGVSIHSGTGVVTVLPAAAYGTVQVQASCGGITGQANLAIGAADNRLTLNAVNGNTYYVSVTASDIASFSGATFNITYDAAVFNVADLCAFTAAAETAAGPVAALGLTFTQVAPGVVKFTAAKSIPSGKAWRGALTVIKLKAKATMANSVILATM